MDAFGRNPQSWQRVDEGRCISTNRKNIATPILWSRITLLFHGAILVIAIITGLWVLPLIFSVSVFIGNWLGYFVGLPQHCGLRDHSAQTSAKTPAR